jgi:hypothetical protein
MRKYTWLVGLTLASAWAGSAQAQKSSSIINFPKTINIMPSITNNAPMDYRNPNAPIGGTTYHNMGYKLSQLFYSPSRPNTFSNTIVNGHSTFPTPAQMQAAAPSWFRPFQMYRGTFIQP